MAFMVYEGLETSGTFPLDSATTGKIKATPKAIIGQTVTFTNATPNGVPEVGYGEANAPLAGIVTAIEQDETGSEKWVVTVERSKTFCDISTANSGTTAVAGKGVAVDGKGGVVTKPEMSNAICMAVDTGKTSCKIWML